MEKKNNKQRHQKFDAQFKQEALKQVENGRSVSTVAQGLGISEAYASYNFKALLAHSGCIQSMSGADNPYDNAHAESFCQVLKYS